MVIVEFILELTSFDNRLVRFLLVGLLIKDKHGNKYLTLSMLSDFERSIVGSCDEHLAGSRSLLGVHEQCNNETVKTCEF